MAKAGDGSASRRPVLVTGAHRSGTTWVGRALAQAPGARMIHEPFNLIDVTPGRSFRPRVWFLHVDDESPEAERQAISAFLTSSATTET